MAFDWSTVETDITEVITEYGQTGAIRPETGSDVPAKFVVAQYDQQERDGELIQFADRKVYLSTTGITTEPTTSDRLVIAGSPSVSCPST
jgi:hypothetical protein